MTDYTLTKEEYDVLWLDAVAPPHAKTEEHKQRAAALHIKLDAIYPGEPTRVEGLGSGTARVVRATADARGHARDPALKQIDTEHAEHAEQARADVAREIAEHAERMVAARPVLRRGA